ncbi:hypothetical protein AB1L12_19820 [Peribacillus frigoritolerans]|uniref:hypothetical protein n=1 Tax=Peribacillus frigoritolerans TaxID=450367 RepID=UPI0039A10A88
MKETDLISPLVKTYLRRGFKAYAEIQLSSRWIDIFMINQDTNETIAVELKLTQWKKAYKQAKIYQMVADYVYVGMPEKYIHRAIDNKELFEEIGIGLLSINQNVSTSLNAKRSEVIMEKIKRELINKLNSESEVTLDEQGNLTKTFYPCGRTQ